MAGTMDLERHLWISSRNMGPPYGSLQKLPVGICRKACKTEGFLVTKPCIKFIHSKIVLKLDCRRPSHASIRSSESIEDQICFNKRQFASGLKFRLSNTQSNSLTKLQTPQVRRLYRVTCGELGKNQTVHIVDNCEDSGTLLKVHHVLQSSSSSSSSSLSSSLSSLSEEENGHKNSEELVSASKGRRGLLEAGSDLEREGMDHIEKEFELDDTFSKCNWSPSDKTHNHLVDSEDFEGNEDLIAVEFWKDGKREIAGQDNPLAIVTIPVEIPCDQDILSIPGKELLPTDIAPWENGRSRGMAQNSRGNGQTSSKLTSSKPTRKRKTKGRETGEGSTPIWLAGEGAGVVVKLKLEVLAATTVEELIEIMDSNLEDMASINLLTLLEACIVSQQPGKVFEIIKWAKRRLKRNFGSHTLTKLIAIAGRHNDVKSAQEFFEFMGDLELERDVFTYNALMNAYAKVEMFDKAATIMEELSSGRSSCRPDAFSYSSAISHNVKAGRYRDAIALFTSMRASHFIPDIVTCGAVAYALSQLSRPGEAELLLEEMSKLGLTLDTAAYSVLVHGYGRLGLFEDVERILKKMEAAGCSPSLTTYTTLMDVYGKAGKLQKVEEFHAAMLRFGLQPSSVSYNCLISCYARNGEFAKAEAIISQMPTACSPSNRTFTDLMDSYAKAGLPDKAQKIFLEMKKRRIVPNEFTFTILVDMWVKLGNVVRAEQVISEMESGGLYALEAYHSMILGYMKAGEVGSAEKLLNFMEKKKLPLSTWTYTLLIRAYGERGDLSSMWKLWNRMLKAELAPNEVTWMAMMQAYEKKQQLDKAEALFRQMVGEGWVAKMEDPLRVYNVMLAAFARNQMIKEAEELFLEMKEKRREIRPDRVSYNTLLNAYSRVGELEKLEELFREMQVGDLYPNEVTYTCVINAFARRKMFGRALIWLECMEAAGVKPNQHTFHSLIGAYSKAGYYKKAEVWFEKMKKAGIKPTESTYSSRIAGYLLVGRFREAEKLVVEMESEGLKPQTALMTWLDDVRRGKVWGLKGAVKVVDGVEVVHRQKKRKGTGKKVGKERGKEAVKDNMKESSVNTGKAEQAFGEVRDDPVVSLEEGKGQDLGFLHNQEPELGVSVSDLLVKCELDSIQVSSAISTDGLVRQLSEKKLLFGEEKEDGISQKKQCEGEIASPLLEGNDVSFEREPVDGLVPSVVRNVKEETGLRRPLAILDSVSTAFPVLQHSQGKQSLRQEEIRSQNQEMAGDQRRVTGNSLISTWKRFESPVAIVVAEIDKKSEASSSKRLNLNNGRSGESYKILSLNKGRSRESRYADTRSPDRPEAGDVSWLGEEWKPVLKLVDTSFQRKSEDRHGERQVSLETKETREDETREDDSEESDKTFRDLFMSSGKLEDTDLRLGFGTDILELAGITSEHLHSKKYKKKTKAERSMPT